jgi:hypothetical protein
MQTQRKGKKNKRKNKINDEGQFLINPILKDDLKKNQKIKLSQLKLTYQTCNIDHKIRITP